MNNQTLSSKYLPNFILKTRKPPPLNKNFFTGYYIKMRKLTYLLCIIPSLILGSISVVAGKEIIYPSCQKNLDNIDIQKLCLEKYFVFQGRPIHPKIIQDFMTWLSDSGDQVVAINLEDSQGADRYCCDADVTLHVNTDGKTSVKADRSEGGWIAYIFHGRTSDGLYFLEVSESSGGSGVFGTLLILKITEEFYFKRKTMQNFVSSLRPKIDKSHRKRLHLKKIATVLLGDRQAHKIQIIDDSLVINRKKIIIPSM